MQVRLGSDSLGQARRSHRAFAGRILANESRGHPGLEKSGARLGETGGVGRGAGNRRDNESKTRDVANVNVDPFESVHPLCSMVQHRVA